MTDSSLTSTTNAPVNKVIAVGVSGAVVTIVVWFLNAYIPLFEEEPIPGEISAAATTVVSFFTSYLVPPGRNEAVLQSEDGKTSSAKKQSQ